MNDKKNETPKIIKRHITSVLNNIRKVWENISSAMEKIILQIPNSNIF